MPSYINDDYQKKVISSSREQCIATVDRSFGHVKITDLSDSDNELFLQGSEADKFIADCDDLFNQGNLSFGDCIYFFASDYLALFCE